MSYVKLKLLSEKCQLSSESLFNVLLKIQELTCRMTESNSFKVLPPTYEAAKLGFFKNNQSEALSENEWFSTMVNDCKKSNGHIYVNLVAKCNEMLLMPIELLSRIHEVADKYVMKVELTNEVLAWQAQLEALAVFSSPKLLTELCERVNAVQRTNQKKLDIFYTLALLYSRSRMDNLIDGRQIIPESKPLPAASIVHEFGRYLTSELDTFYASITEDTQQREIYLPIEPIDQETDRAVEQNVEVFLKHEWNSQEQPQAKILDELMDGKRISRIFMGVNDAKANWRIYGDHPYWMRFRNRAYEELLTCVRKHLVAIRDKRLSIQ